MVLQQEHWTRRIRPPSILFPFGYLSHELKSGIEQVSMFLFLVPQKNNESTNLSDAFSHSLSTNFLIMMGNVQFPRIPPSKEGRIASDHKLLD